MKRAVGFVILLLVFSSAPAAFACQICTPFGECPPGFYPPCGGCDDTGQIGGSHYCIITEFGECFLGQDCVAPPRTTTKVAKWKVASVRIVAPDTPDRESPRPVLAIAANSDQTALRSH